MVAVRHALVLAGVMGAAALAAGAAVAAAEELAEGKARNSYAIGASLGGSVRQLTMETDRDLVLRGFEDALAGKPLQMTAPEIRDTVLRLQKERAAARKTLTQRDDEKNLKDGDAFLEANKAQPGVIALPSGLQYRVLQAGDGPRPGPADTVVCQYRGTLVDGTEFDSSYSRNQPATFAVNRVIKGWSEALQLMPVGSKWQLFVPAQLAYGDRRTGRIGPNSTLTFEVELLAVKQL